MFVRISTFKFPNQTKADAFSELYKNTLMEKYIKNTKIIKLFSFRPGEGKVTIRPGKQMENLNKFKDRFKMRDIELSIKNNLATMSIRDCHDFVTKIWSLDKGAEDLEMNETHTVINQEEFSNELDELGFIIKTDLEFNPIENMMKYYGIELVEGTGWGRQVFIIASPRA